MSVVAGKSLVMLAIRWVHRFNIGLMLDAERSSGGEAGRSITTTVVPNCRNVSATFSSPESQIIGDLIAYVARPSRGSFRASHHNRHIGTMTRCNIQSSCP